MNKKVPFKNNFDRAKKCAKISNYLLYLSAILMIIKFILSMVTDEPTSLLRWIEIINCITIILFLSFDISKYIIHFKAEIHRREDLVDNSFASILAESRTEGYYTNNGLKLGLYKMGVNNFESCFFSYNIAKKELPRLWVKTISLFLLFILVGTLGYGKVLVFIITLSIPLTLIQKTIKHHLFVSRLKNILDRYRCLFNGLRNKSKKNDSEIIRDILEYEATISWGNILLNEKTYNRMNQKLSMEWDELKQEYSIK